MRIAVSCRLDQVNQRDFAKSISKADPDIEVYFITDSQNYPALDDISQQRVYHVQPAWPYFVALNAHHPANKFAYRDVLEQIDPDILLSLGVSHLRFMGPVAGFSPTVLLLQGGETTKFMQPWHDGLKSQIYWRMYRYQFKRALNSFDEIWAAPPNEAFYRQIGFNKSFRKFDWGIVDTDTFRSHENPVEYGGPSDIVIGTFRRQRGEKLIPSYDTFLDAINRLSRQRSDIHVVIGGFYQGESGKKIETLINDKISRYNIGDLITKVDMVPKEDMPRHYSGLDIYINPSHKGHPVSGLGTASKEAMSCECSYITFDDPPKEYIINNGQNGFIIPHNCPKEFSELLNRLCENESLRQSTGKNARETVVEKYSRSTIRTNIVNYCQEIIK